MIQHAGLTCNDGSSDEEPRSNSKLVDTLQGCFKAGMQIGKEHAMNPDIAVQRGPEIPFCSTYRSQFGQGSELFTQVKTSRYLILMGRLLQNLKYRSLMNVAASFRAVLSRNRSQA